MCIQSKYLIGQNVRTLREERAYTDVTCPVCAGQGKVKLVGEDYPCPECHGVGKKTTYSGIFWVVSRRLTIGLVRIELRSPSRADSNNPEDIKQTIEYMCYETGIGTGNIYKEEDMFSSLEEAEAECAYRNHKG